MFQNISKGWHREQARSSLGTVTSVPVCNSAGMGLAERATAFSEEALTFQVLLADRALETLRVIVVVKGLNPAVSSFNWESASDALCSKQLVPVFFAIRHPVFEVERTVAEGSLAVTAHEALRVPCLLQSIEAIPFDAMAALPAEGRHVALVAVLAVQLSLLFDEAGVLEGPSAA